MRADIPDVSGGGVIFLAFAAIVGLTLVLLTVVTVVGNVRVAKHEASVHEVECPQCGTTIRARMADQEPDRQPTVE